jgi:FdhD protein
MLSCRPVSDRLTTSVPIVRVSSGRRESADDAVAVERPLEVRLHGEPFAVIMRTPGDDRALAAGFLFSEGVIGSRDDLVATNQTLEDVIDLELAPSRAHLLDSFLRDRRQVTTNSSCGLCGRRTLDSLQVAAEPLTVTWTIDAAVVANCPETLTTSQRAFALTGGLHAAGLAHVDGRLELTAEDVGRHNAVDKLVGRLWLADDLPATDRLLIVSGRLSFEIVQKAWLAGVPMVVAVSAPSSLSVELGQRAGMTLAGFTRDGRFNVYCGLERIRS